MHRDHWTEKFRRDLSRKSWPKYLYHTCDVTAAIEIVRRGALYPRKDVAGFDCGVVCDVANQGALWNNPEAHEYSRLYIRPRNRFHLKTEGIKSLSDRYRVNPHMTIPVCLAFRIEKVFALDNVAVVRGNFAKSDAELVEDDPGFAAIDFSEVFHNSAPGQARMDVIQNARMSEVVVRGPVSLECMEGLVVRNEFDRWSLQHFLALAEAGDNHRILLDRHGAVFFKRGMSIKQLYSSGRNIMLEFSPPYSYLQSAYRVELRQGHERIGYNLESSKFWRIEDHQFDLTGPIEIILEDCLAFSGLIPSDAQKIV